MTPVSPPSATEAMAALRAASGDPWSRTLERHLVHRRTVAEVLVTSLAPTGARTAALGAQWARAQPFFWSAEGRYDPMLALETLRQAGLALCHCRLGVGLDRQFLLADLRLRVVDPSLLRVGDAPADLVVACVLDALRWRGGTVTSGRIEALVYRDGSLLAEASSAFRCVAPLAYRRLRAAHPDAGERPSHRRSCAPAVAPDDVGRTRPEDVLVCTCPGTGSFGLRVDASHPFLFDHRLDHVPGMAALEACRQAALAATGSRPAALAGMAVAFEGLVPLGGLTSLEASAEGGGEVTVVVRDGAAVLARASFSALADRSAELLGAGAAPA